MIIKEDMSWDRRRKPITYEIDESGCWICTSHSVGSSGYPQIYRSGQATGNRYIYTLLVGKIPRGKSVLHSCDNKRCINPVHLRVGSHLENMRDVSVRRCNSHYKITLNIARAIRELYSGGNYLQKELAEMFGVSRQVVNYIVRNKYWKEI